MGCPVASPKTGDKGGDNGGNGDSGGGGGNEDLGCIITPNITQAPNNYGELKTLTDAAITVGNPSPNLNHIDTPDTLKG